jgi:hypothetical protein
MAPRARHQQRTHRPVRLGAGPDAPKPLTDRAELRQRKQARDNARKARQARSNDHDLPPATNQPPIIPPALPPKAAGLGFWSL